MRNSSSADFVDTAVNADSLEPRPLRAVNADCFCARVVEAGQGPAFSVQRGHPVYPAPLPSLSVSMSIGELATGAATRRHRHAYESLIYVIRGSGWTVVDEQRFAWHAGDALYVPPWCWHQHGCDSQGGAQYLTATNLPLLRTLGLSALRQEDDAAAAPAGTDAVE